MLLGQTGARKNRAALSLSKVSRRACRRLCRGSRILAACATAGRTIARAALQSPRPPRPRSRQALRGTAPAGRPARCKSRPPLPRPCRAARPPTRAGLPTTAAPPRILACARVRRSPVRRSADRRSQSRSRPSCRSGAALATCGTLPAGFRGCGSSAAYIRPGVRVAWSTRPPACSARTFLARRRPKTAEDRRWLPDCSGSGIGSAHQSIQPA
mmetsp:Transcript_4399/g.12621  ORF Transcript_4399/g.12621 Transcript_4399/m.12621 type:complete len:213 (+) Transcript_4399:541-1179(+)